MSGDDREESRFALVQFKDLFGTSGASKALADGLVKGIGEWARPWLTVRNTKADTAAFLEWSTVLNKQGLPVQAAELTLGERTVLRLSTQEQHRQVNREAVAVKALEEARSINSSSDVEELTDPDWLNRFWGFAENVTDSDFQSLWGRILVRQTSRKSSYSLRTLHALSMLSRDDAEALARLAKFTTTTILDGVETIPAIWQSVPDNMAPYFRRLPSEELRALNTQIQTLTSPTRIEVFGPGGIMIENGWAYGARASVENGKAILKIAGSKFSVSTFPASPAKNIGNNTVSLGSGICFSTVGKEIVDLVGAEPDQEYIALLTAAFASHGLDFRNE